MKLTKNQAPWLSANGQYPVILWGEERQPSAKMGQALLDQATLLEHLVKQADEGEINEANLRLQDSLPQSMLDFLPDKLLNDPATPYQLMEHPAEMGTNFQEWKSGLQEALEGQSATPEEARQAFEELTLGSYLDLIL